MVLQSISWIRKQHDDDDLPIFEGYFNAAFFAFYDAKIPLSLMMQK